MSMKLLLFLLLAACNEALRVNNLGDTTEQKPGVPRFTILVNTFQRHACLQESINHYSKCKDVSVQVVWSESPDIPEFLQYYRTNGTVIVHQHPTTNLTNRFIPRKFQSS